MEDWALEFPGAVTICDRDFTIVYMNDRAAEVQEKHGGRALLGTDLMACHKESSREIIRHILETGEPNSYTIEKGGVHKMIYQAPWRKEGRIAGVVELSMEIPAELPHHVRG
jgi:transcriptional regulator with PAS, ATPase and Fis domain